MNKTEYEWLQSRIDQIAQKYLDYQSARNFGEYPLTGKRKEGFKLAISAIKSMLHAEYKVGDTE